jgi:hypothetical protein
MPERVNMQTAILLVISLASLVYFITCYAKRKIVAALATVIFLVAAVLLFRLWDNRMYIPYPSDYLTRLEWLEGSRSSLDEIDCAKFIANAHGDELTFVYWKTKTDMIRVFAQRGDLKEFLLKPGDVANFNGQHVAVYLGSGQWIDADYRRGNVAKFQLAEKPETDPWFTGPVTIRRFKEGVQ